MNKTKTTSAIVLILMGTVALGMAQVRPQLIVVSTTPTSVTLQLQAGSAPLPDGFEVTFQRSNHTKKSLFISADGPECAQFALQPGQISSPFTIDGITNDDCLSYNQTQPMVCAAQYRFFAKAGNIVSTGVTTLTQQCP